MASDCHLVRDEENPTCIDGAGSTNGDTSAGRKDYLTHLIRYRNRTRNLQRMSPRPMNCLKTMTWPLTLQHRTGKTRLLLHKNTAWIGILMIDCTDMTHMRPIVLQIMSVGLVPFLWPSVLLDEVLIFHARALLCYITSMSFHHCWRNSRLSAERLSSIYVEYGPCTRRLWRRPLVTQTSSLSVGNSLSNPSF